MVSASALRDLTISVPEAVIVGHAVTLTCHYDLEDVSDLLYRGKLWSLIHVFFLSTGHIVLGSMVV